MSEGVSNRILSIISLNHFVNDGSTFLIASLFPAMEVAFGFSTYDIGILVALGYLINVIFQPLAGRALAKFQPGVLLPLGISTMAASMFLFSLSSTFPMMIFSIVVMRLGSSVFHPVGASAVSSNYPGSRLDTAMGIESAFGNLGIVFSFILSAPLYLRFGWAGPFYIYAGMQILTVAFTLATMGGIFKSRGSFHQAAGNAPPDFHLQEPVPSNAGGSTQGRKYFLFIPAFFVITAFISGGSNTIFGNFGNLLLFHSGLSISASNNLIALWVAFAFLGAIATGRLTRMLSRIRLLWISYLASGISTLGFGLFSTSMPLAAVTLSVNGFFLAITYPATYSELAFVVSRERATGPSFGMLFSSQIIGASIFGFLSGYFSREFGLASIFLLSSALLIMSVGIVFAWQLRYRPKLEIHDA